MPIFCLTLLAVGAGAPVRAESCSELQKALFAAVLRRDDDDIARLRGALVAALGKQAGVPEDGLKKNEPIDVSTPELARVSACWNNTLHVMSGRYPWQGGAGGRRPRARAVGRWVHALALVGDADETVRAGAEYLLAIQGSNGALGYPVPSPDAKGRLDVASRRLVSELEKRGVQAVEKGYIVQDGGRGELNFDNGEAAMALLAAYAATGNEALPVDAFSLALLAFGPNPLWERALNVEVNGVLAQRGRPLPESLATYLLYRAGLQEPLAPAK